MVRHDTSPSYNNNAYPCILTAENFIISATLMFIDENKIKILMYHCIKKFNVSRELQWNGLSTENRTACNCNMQHKPASASLYSIHHHLYTLYCKQKPPVLTKVACPTPTHCKHFCARQTQGQSMQWRTRLCRLAENNLPNESGMNMFTSEFSYKVSDGFQMTICKAILEITLQIAAHHSS